MTNIKSQCDYVALSKNQFKLSYACFLSMILLPIVIFVLDSIIKQHPQAIPAIALTIIGIAAPLILIGLSLVWAVSLVFFSILIDKNTTDDIKLLICQFIVINKELVEKVKQEYKEFK